MLRIWGGGGSRGPAGLSNFDCLGVSLPELGFPSSRVQGFRGLGSRVLFFLKCCGTLGSRGLGV